MISIGVVDLFYVGYQTKRGLLLHRVIYSTVRIRKVQSQQQRFPNNSLILVHKIRLGSVEITHKKYQKISHSYIDLKVTARDVINLLPKRLLIYLLIYQLLS